MQAFEAALRKHPVIAAVRGREALLRAARTGAGALFLLDGSILTLPGLVALARQSGKRVFVHLDLLDGLGRDGAAVEWCAQAARPDGVISTRAPLIKRAKECGLLTIQRLFVMDSSSLSHGVKLLGASAPDMVEVLPGLVPKAIAFLSEALKRPIIAGGMITQWSEVQIALRAGALGVSSSEESLWNLEGCN